MVNQLLAVGARDHFYRDAERLIQIDVRERKAEKILVNAAVKNPKLSPDGKRVLFNREGERWWRKGYVGERASQVWLYELESGEFKEVLHEGVECMWPLWMANGKGFYFTKGDVHGFDLWRYRFAKEDDKPGAQKQLAGFDEDSIAFPAISRDGKTIVFRHLFDLYRFRPGEDKQPEKIELSLKNDANLPDDVLRRKFTEADEVAFTDDGLEIAFVAGGDVWVMDTKLREPQRVTKTDGYEADVVFAPDGKTLWFTCTTEGQTDVWRASRADAEKFWWQNTQFSIEKITDDQHVESGLRFTPDTKSLIMQQGRGSLVAMKVDSNERSELWSKASAASTTTFQPIVVGSLMRNKTMTSTVKCGSCRSMATWNRQTFRVIPITMATRNFHLTASCSRSPDDASMTKSISITCTCVKPITIRLRASDRWKKHLS